MKYAHFCVQNDTSWFTVKGIGLDLTAAEAAQDRMRYLENIAMSEALPVSAGSANGLRYQENLLMCATHQLTQGLENAHLKGRKGVPEVFLQVLDRSQVELSAVGVQLDLVLSAGRK